MLNHLQSFVVDERDAPGGVATIWGEQSRTRISRSQSGNSFAFLDYRAPAGFGPPRHLHREDDETFFILAGAVALWTPSACRTAKAGDLIMLPRRVPHTWRAYGPEEVHMQVVVSPGEFETFFNGIVARNLTLADRDALTLVAQEAGMDLLGPPLTDDEVALIVDGRGKI